MKEKSLNATTSARKLAHAHLHKLLLWSLGSLIVTAVSMTISGWAFESREWEGQLVQFVFGAVGALASLGFVMFCVLLYGWVRGYSAALRDSAMLETSQDDYFYIHREVFGPIPWR